MLNHYLDEAAMQKAAQEGKHRGIIGGLWEELGRLQTAFLIEKGLQPHHRILDVGCGSLRAGVCLVRYLDPSRYYGIDVSRALINAGYDQEIVPAGLSEKLPRDHLLVTNDFEVSAFQATFDFGLAQSVFTHLTLPYFTRCLDAIAPYFAPGGRLFATFFEVPDPSSSHPSLERRDGVVTYSGRDPFHFSRTEIMAAGTPAWRLDWIGEWGHPRDQQMLTATRR